MTRHRWIQLAALVLTLSALGAGLLLTGPINRQRRDEQLVRPPLATGPAQQQAVTTILATAGTGAFRGLMADVFWYRANKLKDEGKYHEANQLSQWITTLQPTFAQVWVFHAWNMAYNISVATYTPRERWDWVNKGIALLRDKGIPQNPKAILLYKELAWIYFHKIGGITDDVHWYYKRRLAAQWQETLGAPPDGQTAQDAVAWLTPIAQSPDHLADLIRQSPEVQPLLDELQSLGYQPDVRLLGEIGQLLMLTASSDAAVIGVDLSQRPDLDPALARLLQQTDRKPAWEKTLAFLRKKTLAETYHMNPAFMLELVTPSEQGGYGFGPVDWRHPAAHSLYWDALGTRQAMELKNKKNIDLLNTYRGVIHSLQMLTDSGRVNFDPVSGHIDLLPDPRFIPAYEKAYLISLDDLVKSQFADAGGTMDSFDSGYENFLLKAIVYCYLYGSQEQAQLYYDKVRQKFPPDPYHQQRQKRYGLPLAELVFQEMAETIDINTHARQFIDAMLVQAFSQGLVSGRLDVFNHFAEIARYAHKVHQSKSITTPIAPQDRMAMLPFDQLMAESYIGFMQAPGSSLLIKSRLWRNSPMPLKQKTYDRLKNAFQAQCRQAGLNVQNAFPSPTPSAADSAQDPASDLIRRKPAPASPKGPVRVETQ